MTVYIQYIRTCGHASFSIGCVSFLAIQITISRVTQTVGAALDALSSCNASSSSSSSSSLS
ncbi:hypothetical protein E2C01_052083 [Portunus trituberculatus]|uniref:Uncharacterized protein n=1 Tax=Portunus trituberculatus TaxID=210409 RepID=A0A5B7GM39_PORTR|nr:hypothetical protein [Portunus trituberculatus]